MVKPCTYMYYTGYKDTIGKSKRVKDSVFKLNWAVPVIPQNRKAETLNSFDSVYTNEIILDIDMDNINENDSLEDINYDEAEKSIKKIINWLQKKFPTLKLNIWDSGRKGFHIGINFDYHFRFKTHNYGGNTNYVICYHELVNVLNDLLDNSSAKIDKGLEQVTRIIQLPNVFKDGGKPADTTYRGYKVCIWNSSQPLEDFPKKNDFIKASRSNKNIVEPLVNTKKTSRAFISYLNDLERNTKLPKQSNKGNESVEMFKSSIKGNERAMVLNSVLRPILNKLYEIHKSDGHRKVRSPILYTCLEYLTFNDMELVVDILKSDERGSDKSNTRQGLVNAYKQGNPNQWAVWHALGCVRNIDLDIALATFDNDEDKKKFEKENSYRKDLYSDLIHVLEDIRAINSHEAILELLKQYDNNPIKMIENEVTDYIKNSENLFNLIIHDLGAYLGIVSRMIDVNGGSEAGKSALIKAMEKAVPNFKNLGSSTPASIRRPSEDKMDCYNGLACYLGDRGLRGHSANATEEFELVFEIFGGLVTEKSFVKDLVEPNGNTKHYELTAEGIIALLTEPYTNLNRHSMGDQMTTRTTTIMINPLTKEEENQIFIDSFQDKPTPEWYNLNKYHLEYIKKYDFKLNYTNEVILAIAKLIDGLRGKYYIKGLFESYCKYLDIQQPTVDDVNKFADIFINDQTNTVELIVFKKLYDNLTSVIDEDDLQQYLTTQNRYINGVSTEVETFKPNRMLRQVKNRSSAVFFTPTKLKTYFKNDFRMNKNTKDIIDDIPAILNSLYKMGYLDKLTEKDGNENVYYIIKNDYYENS